MNKPRVTRAKACTQIDRHAVLAGNLLRVISVSRLRAAALSVLRRPDGPMRQLVTEKEGSWPIRCQKPIARQITSYPPWVRAAEATSKWHTVAHGEIMRLGRVTAEGGPIHTNLPYERFSCTRNQFIAPISRRARDGPQDGSQNRSRHSRTPMGTAVDAHVPLPSSTDFRGALAVKHGLWQSLVAVSPLHNIRTVATGHRETMASRGSQQAGTARSVFKRSFNS
jgi:hypothetical protein